MPLNETAPQISLSELLRKLSELGGSDLHITTGSPPQVRVDGHLRPLEGYRVLTSADTKQLAYSVLTDAQKHRFEENLELDFSFGVKGLSRFRANLFNQRGAVGAVFRAIPYEIKAFEDLGLAGSRQTTVRQTARLDSRDRSDRFRKVNDAGGDGRQDQSRSSRTHSDDRRSDRVSAQPQELSGQPARSQRRHAWICRSAAHCASPGS